MDVAAQGRMYFQKPGSISTCGAPGSIYYGKDLLPQLLVSVPHRGSLNIGGGMTKTLECLWIKLKTRLRKLWFKIVDIVTNKNKQTKRQKRMPRNQALPSHEDKPGERMLDLGLGACDLSHSPQFGL